MVVINLDDILLSLKDFFSKRNDIDLAILFGSIVRNGMTTHDIDIAIRFSNRDVGLLDLGELISSIASLLGLSIDMVNVIDLDDANPLLIRRILDNFIMIKGVEGDILKLKKLAERYPDIALEIERWASLDPEPKVDKMILISRIEELRRNIDFLKAEIIGKRPEELSYKDLLSLERAIHRIIEAIMDVCRHLVSVYSLGLVESYGEYPKKLADAGKMSRELAIELTKLAGLRNILVHRYLEIDPAKLHNTSKRICEDIYKQFMEWIKKIDPTI